MVRKSKKLPRHLIVYRTSAMGDVAMLAHALRALKRAAADRTVLSISHRVYEKLGGRVIEIKALDEGK